MASSCEAAESTARDDDNPLGFTLDDENWESLEEFRDFENYSLADIDETLMRCEIESTTSSTSSQSRKRKSMGDNEKGIVSQKKREYYLKKQALAAKWKILLAVPAMICSACNSGDADGLKELVDTYFTEDCTYTTKIKNVIGKEEMVKNLLILDEACPDVVIAYKDYQIVNNEIRWTFSFSGTKQFVSAGDDAFDPLTARGASRRMVERASIIKSLGRTYVYFGSGTANLVPTDTLDRFRSFYISSHRCDVRFSDTDDILGPSGSGGGAEKSTSGSNYISESK